MAQDFSRPIYHSARWKHLQDVAMKRSDTTSGYVPSGMCERCYQHGLIKPAKVVHHIKPISPENVNDPSITLNLDNLMRLCQDCHAAVHSSNPELGPPRFAFDESGNLIRRDDEWQW